MSNVSSDSRAVKAGIWYTIGNILIKGINFYCLPLLTKLLSVAEYGDYTAFISYESVLSIIIGFSLHTSLKNAKYKYNEEYSIYLSNVIKAITLSAVFGLLIVSIIYYCGFELLKMNCLSIICLIIISYSSALLMCYNSHIALHFEYKSYLGLSFFNAFSNILFSIVLMITVFSNRRLTGRIIGIAISSAFIVLFILFKTLKKETKHFINHLKWGLSYSAPIIPHGLSQIILSQFDRIMIRDTLGSEDAGLYGFAYNMYVIFNVISNSVASIWEPWFYGKIKSNDYNSIKKVSSGLVQLMCVGSSAFMLISPEIIKILSGKEEYLSTLQVVYPLISSAYFSFLYCIPSVVEYYYGKTKRIAVATFFAAVLNIVLNLILIPKHSYVIAAYTTLITYIVYLLFHYYSASTIHGNDLFDKVNILICSLLSLLTIVVANKIESLMLVRWAIVFVLGCATIIVAVKKYGIRKLLK